MGKPRKKYRSGPSHDKPEKYLSAKLGRKMKGIGVVANRNSNLKVNSKEHDLAPSLSKHHMNSWKKIQNEIKDSKASEFKHLLTVHQIRFYECVPKAIKSMAVCKKNSLLAVARNNGAIELWDIKSQVFQETVILRSPRRSISQVIWVKDHLCSVGYHGDLTEYDLTTLRPKNSVLVSPSAIWCIAKDSAEERIVIGNDDGVLHMYKLDEYGFEFVRSFTKQENRIISVAWRDHILVSGSLDFFVIWDAETGTPKMQIRMDKKFQMGKSVRRRETVVWTIAITRDYQIVTGDSKGVLSFWNGNHGALIHEVEAFKASILTTAVDDETNSVYASGVDPIIKSFSCLVGKDVSAGSCRWMWENTFHSHTHDVHALVLNDGFVISGGLDTYLNFNQPGFVAQSFPGFSKLVCTAKLRTLLLQYPDRLELWKFDPSEVWKPTQSGFKTTWEYDDASRHPMKLIQIWANKNDRILSSAVSRNLDYIAYSTMTNRLKLFAVDAVGPDGELNISSPSLNKVQLILGSEEETEGDEEMEGEKKRRRVLSSPCLNVFFTNESKYLVALTSEPAIEVIALNRLEAKRVNTINLSAVTNYACRLPVVSRNEELVAVADTSGAVFVLELLTGKKVCSLPITGYKPTTMAFDPKRLFLNVIYTNQMFVEYDVLEERFTNFTKETMGHFRIGLPVLPILGMDFVEVENLHKSLPSKKESDEEEKMEDDEKKNEEAKMSKLVLLYDNKGVYIIDKECLCKPEKKTAKIKEKKRKRKKENEEKMKKEKKQETEPNEEKGLGKKQKPRWDKKNLSPEGSKNERKIEEIHKVDTTKMDEKLDDEARLKGGSTGTSGDQLKAKPVQTEKHESSRRRKKTRENEPCPESKPSPKKTAQVDKELITVEPEGDFVFPEMKHVNFRFDSRSHISGISRINLPTNLLYCGAFFDQPGELAAVQFLNDDLLVKLPPVLKKKKFRTK